MNSSLNDNRLVLTLDAGGTNFVFSAIKGNTEVSDPISLPSEGHNLEKSIHNIIAGFSEIIAQLKEKPVAISFAFPGPADFPKGIIGNLGNLPGYRGGVPLGTILQNKFGVPVFINNDGDLFTYGEAIAGFLPWVNKQLEDAGSAKRYKNLFGVTLGTGFGGGIVTNGQLYIGDNAAAGEIWLLRHKKLQNVNAEEGVAIRAIKRVYQANSGMDASNLSPKDIYDIAKGTFDGNKIAAIQAFKELGEIAGDAVANAITLLDSLVVVGGGLTGAQDYILPAMVEELNNPLHSIEGNATPRLEMKMFNLEQKEELAKFLVGNEKQIPIPGTKQTIAYDSMKRTGIGLSKLGTSKAVSIGAYAYALYQLDNGI